LQKVIDAYVKRLLPSHKITNQLLAGKNSKTVGNKTEIKSTAGNATPKDSLNCADIVYTKVDSVQENTEANETNLSVSGGKRTETIDLLKPLITEQINPNVEHIICNVEERYLKVKCLDSHDPNLLNPFEFSKSKEILVKQESSPASSDNDDDNKKLASPSENEEIDKNTLKFCKMLEDFGEIENVKIE